MAATDATARRSPVSGDVTVRRHVARRWRKVRWGLSTSPGQYRAALFILVLATTSCLAGAGLALHERHDIAASVAASAEPTLVSSSDLYVHLADADEVASLAFVTGGLEPPTQRQRYLDDLANASNELTELANSAGGSRLIRDALRTIVTHLTSYTGLIDAARANDRQGFPVGAAYARAASEELRTQVLPAVLDVFRDAEHKLDHAYARGTSPRPSAWMIAGFVLAIVALAASQCWIAVRSHRVINVGLVLATIVLSVMAVASVASLNHLADEVDRARTASDSLVVSSSARVLAVRLRADEVLELAGRGSNRAAYRADFEAVAENLGGGRDEGLLRLGTTEMRSALGQYLAAHESVVRDEDAFNLKQATTNALTGVHPAGAPKSETELFADLIAATDANLATGEAAFSARITSASSSLTAQYALLVVGWALSVMLIAGGIGRRLREFR